MKILITTPSGRIGGRIVPELLAPEFSVRVITRSPKRLPSEIREQVEVVRGSTDDANALCEALDGIDALFWCTPRPSLQEMDVRSYYERFARAAAQAIRQAGTPRVVALSPSGISLGSALSAIEDILNESRAAIRHLRCGWLTENPLEQADSISYPGPGHSSVPMSSADQLADVALKFLVRRDWYGVDVLTVGDAGNLSFTQAHAPTAYPLHQIAPGCT